ncbi:MAG: 2-C-methyl-D-erythritol 2,4-cyclodiphosphate synthase [Bacteroidota bacterium]
MKIKVGLGFDVHQLVEGRDFWLGGIKIPHEKGALGHSDADVLIHAICDALLGAANLGDIGVHFPDTDAAYKGIDSKILLAKTLDLITEKDWKISNVDCTLVLEKPKIKPYVLQMQTTLAQILKLDIEDISIKATTNETMGFIGRQEGVVAYAVTLLQK